jgi:hypothetical protein
MEIESAKGSAAIELGYTEPFRPGGSLAYVHVLLHGPVEAGARVYDDHFETLADYFRELAADWRQARQWESLEGHLSLQATADRAGHIELRVKLRDDGAGDDWRVEAVLVLEAGQLQAIADGVARHLAPKAGAA